MAGAILCCLTSQKDTYYVCHFIDATNFSEASETTTELVARTMMDMGCGEIIVAPASGQALTSGNGMAAARAIAKGKNIKYLVTGTIHEYVGSNFKSDLDGDALVSITMNLVDVDSGNVLWQMDSSQRGGMASAFEMVLNSVTMELVGNMVLYQNKRFIDICGVKIPRFGLKSQSN